MSAHWIFAPPHRARVARQNQPAAGRSLRTLWGATALALLLVHTAAGADPKKGGSSAQPPSTPTSPARAAKAQPATKTAAKAKRPATAGQQPATGTARTLDAITIEGEIAVPQVLFITSREQPRYKDGLHWHFVKTSQDLGEQLLLPTGVLLEEPRP